MRKKANRLDAIKTIISQQEVSSQEELLQALVKEGFELTQATLSRDLKSLQVVKATNAEGKYIYTFPHTIIYRGNEESTGSEIPLPNSLISLQFSGNMAVVRTRPGYASGIAYDIDNRECSCILGSIAGDDTIFLVVREEASHEEVRSFLTEIIPNLY